MAITLDPSRTKLPHSVQFASIQAKLAHAKMRGFDEQGRFSEFVTSNPRQLKELEIAQRMADEEFVKYNVLIVGESGTGKELLARVIGTRTICSAEGLFIPAPFMAQNCGAIPDNLFESIMFGHMHGAFTGSVGDHVGIFESVGKGTVFLDEVGDLPHSQQVKLLRAIETRRINRVGESRERPIECRFVFATNKNLPRMVKLGAFRADLYYRIAERTVRTFPLRDRIEDVLPIAQRVIQRENWIPLKPGEIIPTRAYSKGNVRDLRRALLARELGDEWDDIIAGFRDEDEQENQE